MYSLMLTANGHIDPHGTLAPPIIMRTAATPMPTPKSSLGPESILEEELLYKEGVSQQSEVGLGFSEAGVDNVGSRRCSSTSIDPSAYDQQSLVSYGIWFDGFNFQREFQTMALSEPYETVIMIFQVNFSLAIIFKTSLEAYPQHNPKTFSFNSFHFILYVKSDSDLISDPQSFSSPGRRSPLPLRGSGSSWGSRRSSWNSLGRAPSLKRRDTSGERESLLSGEGGEEEGNSQDENEDAGVNNRLKPGSMELQPPSPVCSSVIAEYGDCNGRTLTYNPIVNSDLKDDFSTEDDLDDDVSYEEELKNDILMRIFKVFVSRFNVKTILKGLNLGKWFQFDHFEVPVCRLSKTNGFHLNTLISNISMTETAAASCNITSAFLKGTSYLNHLMLDQIVQIKLCRKKKLVHKHLKTTLKHGDGPSF